MVLYTGLPSTKGLPVDILVVHTNAYIRDTIADALRVSDLPHDTTVLTADTIEEARRHMRREQVLVVIVGSKSVDFARSLVSHLTTYGSLLDRILVVNHSADASGKLPAELTSVRYDGDCDGIVELVSASFTNQIEYDRHMGIER